MPASQSKLADKYHTTLLDDQSLSFDGQHTVVGLDLDEQEMPNGRFIWFHLKSPRNQGGVLRGTNASDFRVSDPKEIRESAIKAATGLLGDRDEAEFQVDRVIKAGGMLL